MFIGYNLLDGVFCNKLKLSCVGMNLQCQLHWRSNCVKMQDIHSFGKYGLYYPRATRCGGDIVTLLWFRPSVRPSMVPSVCGPCEHDRDYTVACFFVKLGRHVNHDERMNPIDFGGKRSKVKVTMDIYGNKLVNTIETKLLCAS